MTQTLPSNRVVLADAPEPREFLAEFVYNFFVPDERNNETGGVPSSLLVRPSETFESSFVDSIDFNSTVPRYVELRWLPTHIRRLTAARDDITRAVSVRRNLSRIYHEDDFTNQHHTTLYIQETDLDQNLSVLVQNAYTVMGDQTQRSAQDRARSVNANTSPEVSPDVIADALRNTQELGVTFVGSAAETVASVKQARATVQVNNKLIHDMLVSSVSEDTTGTLTDELRSMVDRARTVQQASITAHDSNVFRVADYDTTITTPVVTYSISADNFQPVHEMVGFVIEKTEVKPDGTTVIHDPLVVENPQASTTVDLRVKYGTRYFYSIRSVAYVEVQAADLETNTLTVAGFLLASKPLKSLTVVCEDFKAPPPPADFQVTWDRMKQLPRLTWSFPPNSQRDIKFFQVFKREAVNQPFQLQKMFDFDDSAVRAVLREGNVDRTLIERNLSPKNFWLDTEFKKGQTAIYSVCCVDAHGMTSNYSIQLRVSFDGKKNQLSKKLVSVAGAPKPYPNMLLNNDTFIDTIKDEDHSQVRVVFNPEYLRVYDRNRSDLGLLKTNELDSYRLQLINVDTQLAQTITIRLLDRTESRLLTRDMRRTADMSLQDDAPRTGVGQVMTGQQHGRK